MKCELRKGERLLGVVDDDESSIEVEREVARAGLEQDLRDLASAPEEFGLGGCDC